MRPKPAGPVRALTSAYVILRGRRSIGYGFAKAEPHAAVIRPSIASPSSMKGSANPAARAAYLIGWWYISLPTARAE